MQIHLSVFICNHFSRLVCGACHYHFSCCLAELCLVILTAVYTYGNSDLFSLNCLHDFLLQVLGFPLLLLIRNSIYHYLCVMNYFDYIRPLSDWHSQIALLLPTVCQLNISFISWKCIYFTINSIILSAVLYLYG